MEKTGKLFLITFLTIVAVTALAWIPAKYQWAEYLFHNGRYSQAQQVYDALYYRDSREKSRECSYRLAQSLVVSGNYDKAQQIYDDLGDYKMSALKSTGCEVLNMTRTGGPVYEMVRGLFSTLDEKQSEEELQQKNSYFLSTRALLTGQIREAMLGFEALGSYADSQQRVEDCRSAAYTLALYYLHARGFEKAIEYFDYADMHELSGQYEKYCALRLESQDMVDSDPIITPGRLSMDLYYGKLYFYEPAFVYIPNEIDTETKFLAYFAGGMGEPMLFKDSVYEYIWEYAPNAVMVFYEISGIKNIPYASQRMIQIVNQAAAECGIGVKELVVGGSSNGCYTALHTAASFYEDDCVAPKAVITLDTGADWASPMNLNTHERALLAEAGTKFYLFEQPDTVDEISAIEQLVDSGIDVTAVYCTNDDHDEITVLAFTKGVFSWAMGEYEELDRTEYTLYPILR